MSRDANKEQSLKALYAELNKLGQNGEYEKAIKTANRSEFCVHVEKSMFHMFHILIWTPQIHKSMQFLSFQSSE